MTQNTVTDFFLPQEWTERTGGKIMKSGNTYGNIGDGEEKC